MFKRILSVVFSIIFMFSFVVVPPHALAADGTDGDASSDISGDYVAGQVIVCFDGTSSAGPLSVQSDDGFDIETLLEVPAAQTASSGALTTQSSGKQTLALVRSDTLSTDELIAQLSARQGVAFVEPDYLIETGWEDEAAQTESGETDGALTTQATSPIGDYSQFQWGLSNDGTFLDGTSGIDIDNSDGLTGSDKTVVAVIDSGIDDTNPNLTNQMIDLSAYGNLMADTGAGTHGYNSSSYSTAGDHSQTDDTVGHGTHVAGIIGADGSSSGTGAHGVMQDVTLMAVKLCDSNNGDAIPESSLARGIGWLISAKENYGINVCAANMSIGSDTSYQSVRVAFQALDDAGIILCVSSGNESQDISMYGTLSGPARSGDTIIVDAEDPNGNAAYYTNYGSATDLFAPGSSVYSTVSANRACFDSFRAQADSEAYIYDGFEATSTGSDVTQTASPSVTSQQTGLYLYDGSAAGNKGAAVTTLSTDHHLLGQSSLKVDVASTGTTLVSDVFDLSSSSIDWTQMAAGMSVYGSPGVKMAVDFRLKDGSFTGAGSTVGVLNALSAGSWSIISSTSKHALSTIDNLDTENFQMKITLTPTSGAATAYIDALGVGEGFRGYTLMSGTSMASPMVAGVTGLLCSEFGSTECSQRISARVVGGAKQTTALDGKCRTGGMVDVHKAATNPDPVIQDAKIENGKLVLSGWFIGDTAGQVSIGGTTAEIAASGWKADTQQKIGTISVKIPDGVSGQQDIKVTSSDGRVGYYHMLLQNYATDYEELSILPSTSAGDVVDLAYGGFPFTADGKLMMLLVSHDVYRQTSTTLSVWTYDTGTTSALTTASANPWTELPEELTLDVNAHDVYTYAYANGKIWAFVGPTRIMDILSGVTTKLYSYDIATHKWASYDSITYPTGNHLFAWNGNLYLIGGSFSETMTSNDGILKVDPATGAFTKVATISDYSAVGQTAVSGNDLIMVRNVDGVTTSKIDLTGIDESSPDKVLTVQTYEFPFTVATDAMDLTIAFAPTLTGAVMAGYGSYLDEGDTYFFDKTSGTWTRSDKRLTYDTSIHVAGTTYGNGLYVWGKTRDADDVTFFRRLTLWNEYVISATVTPDGSGTVSGTGTVAEGGTITLTATPAAGYHFVRWMEGDQVLGTDATLTLSDVMQAHALTAVFEPDATPTPTPTPEPTPTPTPEPTPTPATDSSSATSLPWTGDAMPAFLIGAAAMLALGTVLVRRARRVR